jgi:hypothetical protein
MLDPTVVAKARKLLRNPDGPYQLRIIEDPDDTYFSHDLADELKRISQARAATSSTPPIVETRELRETDSSTKLRDLGNALCTPAYGQTIWLFAGRGNQLTGLDQHMTSTTTGRSSCDPVVIAGPGGLSAIAASNEPKSGLTHFRNLLFYSLVDRPAAATVNGATAESLGVGWANAVARASDRSTGYAALVEALHRADPSVFTCPNTPSQIVPIGLNIPPGAGGNGHNTLGPSTGTCGQPGGTPIYFCRYQRATAPSADCPAVSSGPTAKPAPKAAATVTATAHRGLHDPGRLPWYDEPKLVVGARGTLRPDGLPWTSTMSVVCVAPGETVRDGWVGVNVPGHALGFVHWKAKYQDQNYYLKFTLPTGQRFDQRTMKISSYVQARCPSYAQLEKLAGLGA